MGKSSRTRKEERKARREAETAAKEAYEKAMKSRRMMILAIPTVSGVLAGIAYFVMEDSALAGWAILGGALITLIAGLGYLGSVVSPKDRVRAGSIDFGGRK